MALPSFVFATACPWTALHSLPAKQNGVQPLDFPIKPGGLCQCNRSEDTRLICCCWCAWSLDTGV